MSAPRADAALAPLAMIAAMTPERVIGRGAEIPWHYPQDMKHFRTVTAGHAVIMGRTTYDSIGKPLPRRRNIVVSRNPERIEGVEVARDLEQAIELARSTDPEPMILGGAQIYSAALPLATRLYLTYVHEPHPGDVHFPALQPDQWREVERREDVGLTFVTLQRI